MGYIPDPTMEAVRYPPPPSNTRAKDGVTAVFAGTPSYGRLTSASVDFIKKSILPGDQLIVDFVPIIGDLAQTGPSKGGRYATNDCVWER
jgi:hypothetical protein